MRTTDDLYRHIGQLYTTVMEQNEDLDKWADKLDCVEKHVAELIKENDRLSYELTQRNAEVEGLKARANELAKELRKSEEEYVRVTAIPAYMIGR